MELAWLFIRKPQIDPNEPVTKSPDKPIARDWGWAIGILCIAGLLIYAVHTGPDSSYPGGRAGLLLDQPQSAGACAGV